MGEFATLILVLGFILLLVQYYVLRFRPEIALLVFSYSAILLSGVGMYIVSADNRVIFEVFLILSLIASVVLTLQVILGVAHIALKQVSRRGI